MISVFGLCLCGAGSVSCIRVLVGSISCVSRGNGCKSNNGALGSAMRKLAVLPVVLKSYTHLQVPQLGYLLAHLRALLSS